jgi:type I restriction-modification system DNA methylase subunit
MNIARIVAAYRNFETEQGFSATATLTEVADNDSNLSIPLYVKRSSEGMGAAELPESLQLWREGSSDLWVAASELFELLAAGQVAP